MRYLLVCIIGAVSEEALASYVRACWTGVDFPAPRPANFFDTSKIWIKTTGYRFFEAPVAHSPTWGHLLKYADKELGHEVDEYSFNILLHWMAAFDAAAENRCTMRNPSTMQEAIAAAAQVDFMEAQVYESKQKAERRQGQCADE